jgi:hypothetical protein
MPMPTDVPIFEVRATLANGSRMRLGLYATLDGAAEQSRLLLATGVATRVETIKRVAGQIEVLAVHSPRARFGARQTAELS